MMKLFKFTLISVLSLICFIVKAQEPAQTLGTKTGAVKTLGRHYIDSAAILPFRDTTYKPLRIGAFQTSILDTLPYWWDGTGWRRMARYSDVSGGGSPTGAAGGDLSGTYPNPDVRWTAGYPTYDVRYLPEFTPGYVTWSGSGLTFDVTAASYTIDGTRYSSDAGSITLDAADATDPRYDVIALDNTGTIVKITGTAAATPSVPQVDPATQIALTTIRIDAGATTPSEITQELIYDENAENWTGTNTGVTVNFDNTTTVYHSSKSADVGSWTNGQTVVFTKNTGTSNASDYSIIKMYINLKSSISGTGNVRVSFLNGSTVVSNVITLSTAHGFTKTVSGSYQNISIPISAFTFSSTTFNKIRITLAGTGGGMYLDYVQLQSGVATTVASESDPIAVNKTVSVSPGYGLLIPESVTQQLNGNPSFTPRVDTFNIATRDRVNKVADSLASVIPAGGGSGSTNVYLPLRKSNDTIYRYYNVLHYGLVGDGVTDNTAAINNLLLTAKTECAGGTAVIEFPYTGNSYIIAGALQTADSCQVCIPFNSKDSIDKAAVIILRSEGQPSGFTDWGYASTDQPNKGVIIESTSTKQTGSVIGSIGATDTINGNFNTVIFENMWIRVRSKNGTTHVAPAMKALDIGGLEMVKINNCRFDTQSPADSSVQPLSTAVAINLPQINNWGIVEINDCLIQNFYDGIVGSEHISADNLTIATCMNAVKLVAGFHVNDFKKLNLWWNVHNIVLNGTSYFKIHNLDFEEYNPTSNPSVEPSRWFNNQDDLVENLGSSHGDIIYQRTVAGVGTNNTFNTTSTNTNITYTSVGKPWSNFTTANFSGTVNMTSGQLNVTNSSNYSEVLSQSTLSSQAGYFTAKNNNSHAMQMSKRGSAAGAFGPATSNDGLITNTGSGNMVLYNFFGTGGIILAAGQHSTADFKINSNGSLAVPATITAAGTTGAQTINKSSGTVNFAAGASTLTVTNSLATSTSTVIVTVYGSDATAMSARVTRASGSFTITLNAAATAETTVGFLIINNY